MSNEVTKPTYPSYYIAHGNGVRHVGVVEPNQVVTTGQPNLLYSDDPNTFAGEAEAAGVADFNPLPAYDADNPMELQQGEIYTHNGKLVIVRQDHIRTEHDPATVPALFSTYRENPQGAEWVADESVIRGDRRTFSGKTWVALQDHTTQADWTPDAVPALWAELVEAPINTVWAAGITVAVGDEYYYPDADGTLYRVLQAHTTQAGWTPPAVPALWEIA